MRKWFLIGALAAACVAAGCGDSTTGPGGTALEYPDVPGLVAFFQFDGNLEDSSVNGLDATGSAGIAYVNDHNGAASSAVLVAGASDTIMVANRGAFDFVGGFTVAGWIMPGLGGSMYGCVVDKGYADGDWSVGTNSAGTPSVRPLYLYVGTHTHSFTASDAIAVGQSVWTHFACSFNDTTNVARLYVNGAIATVDTYAVDITASGRNLRIGSSHWADGYEGAIDQVALFDRVLTDAEVLELYNFD